MTELSLSLTHPSTGKHAGGRPKGTTYDTRDRHCYDLMQSLIDQNLVSCLRVAARKAIPLAYLYGLVPDETIIRRLVTGFRRSPFHST
jgi:hypothetical protein